MAVLVLQLRLRKETGGLIGFDRMCIRSKVKGIVLRDNIISHGEEIRSL